MIELCSEYLSVQCIWLYFLVVSHMRFRVNPHSYSCLNVKELLVQIMKLFAKIWFVKTSIRIKKYKSQVVKSNPQPKFFWKMFNVKLSLQNLEPSETSTMESSAKKPLTILQKCYLTDVWLGSKDAFRYLDAYAKWHHYIVLFYNIYAITSMSLVSENEKIILKNIWSRIS